MLFTRRLCQKNLQITDGEIIWKGKHYRTVYFIRRVFYYLHAHRRLLKKPMYRILYEECLNMQAIRLHQAEQGSDRTLAEFRDVILLVADISVKHHGKRGTSISRSAVDAYLRYRQKVWFNG